MQNTQQRLWSFVRPVYGLFILLDGQFYNILLLLVALQPISGPFPPVFLPQSLLRLAIACQFFILSSLVPSLHSLPSHLFLSFLVGLLPPRPPSRVCFGIPVSNILTTCLANFWHTCTLPGQVYVMPPWQTLFLALRKVDVVMSECGSKVELSDEPSGSLLYQT